MKLDVDFMKTIWLLFVLLGLSACAHHPVKVDCDKHLTAINPPRPIVKTAAPVAPSTP
jgi:hypothetical protein